MHRILLIIILIPILHGCTVTKERLIGSPVHSEHDGHVMWENIAVYGKLMEQTLRAPTQVYQSSFGHAFCMVEGVTFDVSGYIEGSGPKIVEFSQNKIDSCSPLAEDIGFGKSILFLSKNKYRGVWITGSARVDVNDGESRIVRPSDILHFSSFNNFELALSSHEKPLEWYLENDFETTHLLNKLKKIGILNYKLISSTDSDEYYSVTLFKYLQVDKLLKVSF
jgi:hypothetical protein